MSKFKTAIPVDVEAVVKLLPPSAFLHEINWNGEASAVEVLWSYDNATTGRDFPVEFPLEALQNRTALPAGIRVGKPVIVERAGEPPAGYESPPAAEAEAEAPRKPVTEQDMERSLAEGQQAIEAARERGQAAVAAQGEETKTTEGTEAAGSAHSADATPVRTEPEKTVEKKKGRK